MTTKTDEKERAELLPCPFCGGEAIMQEHPPHQHSEWLVKMGMPEYSPGSFTIECVACECGMIHETREGVVAAWNRRAALQSQDAEDAERWRKAKRTWRIFRLETLPGVTVANRNGIPWADLETQVDIAIDHARRVEEEQE